MIVENYTNELSENKETRMTFISDVSPVLFVRQFNQRLDVADKLVLPYYVDTYDESLFRENRVGATFTTIIRFDEDALPEDDVVEFKQTTYAGEQVIEIELGESPKLELSPGLHSFSIKTIQNTGVGSPVQYFRIFVEDSSQEPVTVDLNELTSFESGSDGSVGKNEFYKKDSVTHSTLYADEASYQVSVNRSGNNVDITITVDGSMVRTSYYNSSAELPSVDISGTYHVVTHVDDGNGNTVRLADYVPAAAEDIPTAVMLAAARNKVALTMLFRAVNAYSGEDLDETRHVLVMPENMDIVIDYHDSNGRLRDTNTTNGRIDTESNRDDIEFPNNFTWDLNGSTVMCLHVVTANGSGSWSGNFIRLNNNINVRITNGSIRGNYIGYYYGSNAASETVRSILINHSYFCTFDRLDISGAPSYDLILRNSVSFGSSNAQLFDTCGFIDYDGAEVIDSAGYNDGDVRMMFTSGYAQITPSKLVYMLRNAISIGKHVDLNYADGSYHRSVGYDLFIHYYDHNQDFIKTEKIYESHCVLAPYGTEYIRLSMKGSPEGKGPDRLVGSDGTAFWAKGESLPNWGNVIKDCDIHDTRSCIVCIGGLQSVLDSCRFWGVSEERSKYNPNPVLLDVEDGSEDVYNAYINNCERVYGNSAAVVVYQGFNINFTNNRELGLVIHAVNGGLVQNHYGSVAKYSSNKLPEPRLKVEGCHITELATHVADRPKRGSREGFLTLRGCSILFPKINQEFSDSVHLNDCITLLND